MAPNYRGRVDQLLSGISVGYAYNQDLFVADKVFPTLGVNRQSDFYYVYPKGWKMRSQVERRPLGGEPVQAQYGLANDSYRAEEYALAMSLDDRERANVVAPFDPEREHIEFLTENHLIFREIEWAKAYFQPDVWGATFNGVSGGTLAADEMIQFSNADSQIQREINNKKKLISLACGRPANVLVVGADVHTELQSHPEIIERTKYTSDAAVTRQIIARYFELDDYMVLESVHNVAPELAPQFGDSVELEYIADSKSALLMYRANSVGLKTMTAGMTFNWRGLLGAEGFQYPVYRERLGRAWSDWFAVRTAFDFKIVAPDCGVFMHNLVA